MADAIVLTKQLAAANAALFATAQQPVSGTPLNLTGSQPDTPRRVLLTFGNEVANRTMVLTGTMEGGAAISETLAVPSGGAGTVASLQDFASVTSALPLGGGWSANVTLGTNTVGSTRWAVPNFHITPFQVALGFYLLSGAVTADVEISDTSVLPPIPTGYAQAQPLPVPTPVSWLGMTGLNANAQGVISDRPCQGIRLTIRSGTGQAQLVIMQSGIRN